MLAKSIIKKVRKIEIKTRGLSDQVFSGHYHSSFKGRGMSFSEVREYQYGDDVRNIDWNVTARLNHPYIKVFEEERELTVMLIVDVSGSNAFGTQDQFKNEQMTEIAAVLAFSAIKNNDKVGVIFFSDKVEKFIPPKKGRSHILRIIHELIDFKPESKKTNIQEALRFLTNAMKKRTISFLISDFIDTGFEDAIKIAARKHDLVAIRIYDKREMELSNIGLVKIYDNETGAMQWLDTSSSRVREAWKRKAQHQQEYIETLFFKSGVDKVDIMTNQDYVKPLLGMFRRREGRR
jgi:uncharacterized protein (DUF58 family)